MNRNKIDWTKPLIAFPDYGSNNGEARLVSDDARTAAGSNKNYCPYLVVITGGAEDKETYYICDAYGYTLDGVALVKNKEVILKTGWAAVGYVDGAPVFYSKILPSKKDVFDFTSLGKPIYCQWEE